MPVYLANERHAKCFTRRVSSYSVHFLHEAHLGREGGGGGWSEKKENNGRIVIKRHKRLLDQKLNASNKVNEYISSSLRRG
jgi:hypothetical protein